MTKRVLVIDLARLTDFDGKTLRLLRYADALEEMGYDLDFLTLECESLRIKKKFRVFECPTSEGSIFDRNYYQFFTEISNASRIANQAFGPVLNMVKEGRYSMVLSSFTSSGLPTIVTAMTLAKVRNIPHIYDYDDLGPEMASVMKGWSSGHPFYHTLLFLEKVICRYSSVVLAMSQTMKRLLLVRTGSSTKMEVIYNVPPSREFGHVAPIDKSRERLGIAANLFVFAYLGNVQRRIRGLETLVEAVKVLKSTNKNFLVFMVGTGDGERHFRRSIHQAGLSEFFHFTGNVSKEQATSYFNATNVSLIILPSIQADYMAPTKLFISMALGKHIVSTESKQIRLILGSTPIYVKKNTTPEELAHAMAKAQSIFRREDVNEGYRDSFLNTYCWEREKEKFKNTILNLAS